tara:strand:- start:1 stop:375 length:375 start_codon:yes stop_codon:yes gene_type:complete
MDSDYEYEVESNLSDNESDPDTTTVFQTSELPDSDTFLKTYETRKKTYITDPCLTKYEKTKVLSERAHQIENGAVLYIQKDNSLTQAYQIALEEFKQKKIPFIICRPLPNAGGYEYWKLNDLLY